MATAIQPLHKIADQKGADLQLSARYCPVSRTWAVDVDPLNYMNTPCVLHIQIILGPLGNNHTLPIPIT